MSADITFAQCAQDGIGQRMHGRIRIRMAFQFFIMGNFNTAQHHAITSFKLVKINALSDAHIQPLGVCSCRQNSVCLMDIFRRRELLVFRPARNHPHLDTKFFGNCRIIRQALQILLMGLCVGRRIDFSSKPCGVCTDHMLWRSTVRSTRPPGASLIVSAMGRPGMTHSDRSSSAIMWLIRSAETKGRAAS